MKIGVCSFFRDSEVWINRNINQIDKYFNYLSQQEKLCDDVQLEYFLLEGDSKDNTFDKLKEYSLKYPVNLIKYEVINNSEVSSAGSDDRRKILSEVGNVCLKPAVEKCDYILWMESDLIPYKSMLNQLIDSSQRVNWDKTLGISPVAIIKINKIDCFYDGWAFEGINGEKWGLNDLGKFRNHYALLKEMKTIGSCCLLNGKLLRENNIDFSDGCFPKMCKTARDKGYPVYCNIKCDIYHPSQACINRRWI